MNNPVSPITQHSILLRAAYSIFEQNKSLFDNTRARVDLLESYFNFLIKKHKVNVDESGPGLFMIMLEEHVRNSESHRRDNYLHFQIGSLRRSIFGGRASWRGVDKMLDLPSEALIERIAGDLSLPVQAGKLDPKIGFDQVAGEADLDQRIGLLRDRSGEMGKARPAENEYVILNLLESRKKFLPKEDIPKLIAFYRERVFPEAIEPLTSARLLTCEYLRYIAAALAQLDPAGIGEKHSLVRENIKWFNQFTSDDQDLPEAMFLNILDTTREEFLTVLEDKDIRQAKTHLAGLFKDTGAAPFSHKFNSALKRIGKKLEDNPGVKPSRAEVMMLAAYDVFESVKQVFLDNAEKAEFLDLCLDHVQLQPGSEHMPKGPAALPALLELYLRFIEPERRNAYLDLQLRTMKEGVIGRLKGWGGIDKALEPSRSQLLEMISENYPLPVDADRLEASASMDVVLNDPEMEHMASGPARESGNQIMAVLSAFESRKRFFSKARLPELYAACFERIAGISLPSEDKNCGGVAAASYLESLSYVSRTNREWGVNDQARENLDWLAAMAGKGKLPDQLYIDILHTARRDLLDVLSHEDIPLIKDRIAEQYAVTV